VGAPTGQAPASDPQSPSSSSSSSSSSFQPPSEADWKRVQAELAEARRDAAGNRSKLKAIEDAQLSEAQKLERRATEAEASVKAYQARVAGYEVRLAAQRLGIIDPDLAALAIRDQLEYEDDGTPKNADKLLADLLKAKPYLAGGGAQQGQGQAQGQRPPASSGGATNPGSGARAGVFTREQIRRMTPAEYAQNQQAIFEAMKNGQVR